MGLSARCGEPAAYIPSPSKGLAGLRLLRSLGMSKAIEFISAATSMRTMEGNYSMSNLSADTSNAPLNWCAYCQRTVSFPHEHFTAEHNARHSSSKDVRELLRRARMGFVQHLCTDGVPYGSEQDPSITCLACEIDSVLRATVETKEAPFSDCVFSGAPPQGFISWNDWTERPPYRGVEIHAQKAKACPSPCFSDGVQPHIDGCPEKTNECPTCEGAGIVASQFGLAAAPGTQPDIEPCPDCTPVPTDAQL